MDRDQRIKARLRLALRAEKAMGMSSLPIALERRVAATQPAPPRPTPATPQPTAHRPPPTQRAPVAPPPPARPAPNPLFPTTPPPAFTLPTEPFTAPLLSRQAKIDALKALAEQIDRCAQCRLHEKRIHTVPGEGDPDARIMFIGEGPGENEDQQGRPFVGKAGQLLDKMIQAMGLERSDVFICNTVKCRPPGNREPAPDETAACAPYLLQQIEIVRPAVIVTLGRPATQFILQSKLAMSRLRGQWHDWRGIKVMPTYHPAYVLRQYTRETREAVWSDLKQVLGALNLPVPARP